MAKADDNTMALAAELRAVFVQLKRRLREQAPPIDLTWSQLSVLGLLDREGPSTVSELARAEGVRPQSMGEIVATLQSAGLVAGKPDPQDGRRTLLALTQASRDMVRARRAQRDDWLFQMISQKLSPLEQKELLKAVSYLRRLVEPNEP